jgi:hypothetical protein
MQADSLIAGRSYRFSSSGAGVLTLQLDVALTPDYASRHWLLPMREIWGGRCDHQSDYYMTIVADTVRMRLQR